MEETEPGSEVADAEPTPQTLDADVVLAQVRQAMFKRGELPRLARYELLQVLGRGAHGSVYLARDVELDRRVAVKLLRTESDPNARARLQREAQALARLKHPNVMTVHDVGVEGGRVFVAMEYVESGTLARWCTQNPPGTAARHAAVFDLLLGAARGLAAAHEQGLIHRDIKPANILIGDDGRPRIADFGLVRSAEAPMSTGPDRRSSKSQADDSLTATGQVLGTPAYMGPEHFGGHCDAKSDQWSLCASFWEAAYDERPFVGETRGELMAAVHGAPRPPPAERTEVPDWWRDILTRGLHADPGQRWPSITELIDALERAAARRRRKWRFVGAIAAATVGAGALGWQQLREQQRRQQCQDGAEAITEVWNEEAGDELRAALARTGVAYAEATYTHAVPYLDAYAAKWSDLYTQTCDATMVEQTRSNDLWTASEQCFADRKNELDAVLDVLIHRADAATARRTVSAVAAVGRIENCMDDVHVMRSAGSRRSASAQEVALRETMTQAKALDASGLYQEADDLLQAAAAANAEHPNVRLAARLLHLAGIVRRQLGDFDGAGELLTASFDRAFAAGEIDIALHSAVSLVFVEGYELSNEGEGRLWGRVAEGLVEQLSERDTLIEALLRSNLGSLRFRHGDYDAAIEAYERALELRMSLLGPHHPEVGDSHHNLAVVYRAHKKLEDAESRLATSLDILEQALGPDHPSLAKTRTQLGLVYELQSRLEDAERVYLQTLHQRERALGGDHPDVAESLSYLAGVYEEQGRIDEAEQAVRRALSIQLLRLGPSSPDTASTYTTLGDIYSSQKRYDEAIGAYRKSIEGVLEGLSSEHPMLAAVRNNLGQVLEAAGREQEALVEYRQAVAILNASVGPEHPDTQTAKDNVARLEARPGSADAPAETR